MTTPKLTPVLKTIKATLDAGGSILAEHNVGVFDRGRGLRAGLHFTLRDHNGAWVRRLTPDHVKRAAAHRLLSVSWDDVPRHNCFGDNYTVVITKGADS